MPAKRTNWEKRLDEGLVMEMPVFEVSHTTRGTPIERLPVNCGSFEFQQKLNEVIDRINAMNEVRPDVR